MKNKFKAFKIPIIHLHYTMLKYHFNLENIHKHIILMWKKFTFEKNPKINQLTKFRPLKLPSYNRYECFSKVY